ncbi:hypothetical protein BH10ACT8_BH10ACT8_02880 [soil metagenome]
MPSLVPSWARTIRLRVPTAARRRATPPAAGDESASRSDDSGFLLLEAIFTISIITIVMTAMATFFVTSIKGTNQQRGYQSAIQVTDSAVEFVRSLSPAAVLDNRDAASVTTQFNLVGVSNPVYRWLQDMNQAADSIAPAPANGTGQNACPSATACAQLPTVASVKLLNGATYRVNYYVGSCMISSADSTNTCAKTGTLPVTNYLRVVVATTWSDSHCASSLCTYVTATLINVTGEPTFKLNQPPIPPPTVTNPGTQTLTVGGAANLTILASGGATPYTWSVTGLPNGLAMDTSGVITGTATVVGSFSVTATATDSFINPGSATFTWNIVSPPSFAAVAAQTGEVSVPDSLQMTATGGTTPYTWSIVNQPTGLSINSSGLISGTPTVSGTFSNILVSVKDSSKVTSTSAPFTWTISPALSVGSPGSQLSEVGVADIITIPVSGGRGTLTWSSSTLPAGMTLNSNGTITGTPTGSYSNASFSVSAKDQENVTSTSSFSWTIYSAVAITAVPDQVTSASPVSITLASTGGSGSNVWSTSATTNKLPPGISLSGAGVLSGTMTGTGTYTVTVYVTDSLGGTDSDTFLWSDLTASTPANQTTTRPTGNTPSAPTVTLTATKGKTPYTWTVTAGKTLPSWLTLSGNTLTGSVSKTTTTGTTTIYLTVTDGAGATRNISFTWKIQ